MRKRISSYNGYIPVIFTFFGIILIFIDIPILGIEILQCLNITSAIGICIWKSKIKNYTEKYPITIEYFSYLNVGIAIAVTRTFLTIETYEEQVLLIRIVGEFICRENVIFGFVSTLIIGILLTSFCLWYVHTYLSETKSCLLKLESEAHGRWISARQNNNEEKRLNELNKFENYYVLADSSVNLIVNIFKVFIGIFCIDVAGGVCLDTFMRGMFWNDALEKNMIISSGYFIYLCIPLIIVSFSFRINEKQYYARII